MLEVKGLNAWYGESHILHGVDFEVREGEVVTLLGRNGAGKTTTLKSIMGLVDRRAGSVTFRGAETIGLRPDRIARAGIALCPEERGIFAALELHAALAASDQAHDRLQCRGLAGTVTAKQGHHLTFADVEIHAVQDVAFAVPGIQVVDAEKVLVRH